MRLRTGRRRADPLSFVGVKAIVPTACGQWPEDLASGSSLEGWKNEPYSNFGCATQSMIAAQVDDPRDFVQPRALGPSDVAMRTRAIEDVRKGQDPGTQWNDTVLTPDRGASRRGTVIDEALYAGSGTDVGPPMDRPVAQIDPVPRVSIQAFCESPEVAAIVSAAIADRRMAKAHVKLNMGGAPAAVEAYRSAPTPNVVVLEAPADRDALLEQLDELAQFCDAGTKVVVLGKVNDIVLYRQLIARGVSEYLVAPFGVVEFVQAVSQLFSVPGAKPLGRVIAVVGAKGGVGASTVAHNLAWSLASVTEMATIIADFDLGVRNRRARLQSGSAAGRRRGGVRAGTRRRHAGRSAAVQMRRQSQSARRARPRSIASSTLPRPRSIRSSTPCGRRRRGSCSMCRMSGRAGPGGCWSSRRRGDRRRSPDLANLRNAKNLIDNMKSARPNDRPPRLVLNGVGMLKRPEIAAAEFAKTVEIEPAAVIPHDAKLFGAAANNGQMIAEIEPNGKTAEIFADLASALAGRAEVRKPKRGVLEPLMAKLGRKRK